MACDTQESRLDDLKDCSDLNSDSMNSMQFQSVPPGITICRMSWFKTVRGVLNPGLALKGPSFPLPVPLGGELRVSWGKEVVAALVHTAKEGREAAE